MAWETIAQIYRAAGTAYGTTYWDIDTDTTELNDDFTKYVTVQFNGQTLYVTKSAVYDFESYGGAIILVVKDTTNSGYIRERLIHSQSSYNYTTLLTPNYTENGLKVYIKSLSPEHLPNVQIPVTSNVGGSSMTTNISIFSDRITRVYTYQDYMALMELPKVTSNGGGATHIAKRTGQLKDLSSYTSDILIVSGGGGGGLLVGETAYTGKEAGGISGSGDNSADQSTGNAFGLGESGTNVSGGGSGLYGGYKGTSSKSGGAGSGYIGNSLLSNKKMVGYNVPTSSAEGTKTESVNDVSASAVSGKPKSGNGFARIKFLREIVATKYGFHINGNGTDPDDMVTYLDDAVGKTPAHMNFSTGQFDYGSWENAFFMPKPCILGQDGVVQKYLNPNDYTKDIDGNSVVIDSNLQDANVMVEFPKIWVKVEPDENDQYSGSVWISDTKLDDSYHDWAYISESKVHKDRFYLAAYNSEGVSSVLRSRSGTGTQRSQSGGTQISQAKANGTGWYIETVAQIDLVNYLLILISKSLDSQAKFGRGICDTNGSSSTVGNFRTGQHNDKGLFYGTTTGTAYTDAVKVFGIENWWGMILKRYAGEVKNTRRCLKMCWGQEDGSTTDDFGTGSTGYVDTGDALPSSSANKAISKMHFISGKGFYAVEWNADDDTKYCDRQSFGSNNNTMALAGGFSDGTFAMGIFFRYYSSASNTTYFTIGANISYI